LPWFKRQAERLKSAAKGDKGISILVPCYNEQGIIDTSINSMKSLSYSAYDVIYINDGSTDDTMLLLNQFLQLQPSSKQPLRKIGHEKILGFFQSKLYPNIYVIDKENGGKADSLNA
jgi:glycosyltransferase involved in cell wall biosynthesis